MKILKSVKILEVVVLGELLQLATRWDAKMAQPQYSYKPAVFEQLEVFDLESDSVMAYPEQVDIFFAANDIGPDKQVSVF